MDRVDVDELIGTITSRADLLRELREDPQGKATLVESLPVSRSTVDRAVRELASVGILTRDSGTVRLTVTGELFLQGYERYVAEVTELRNAELILRNVKADQGLDIAVFRDADVLGPAEYAPHEPLRHFKSVLREAERVRGVAGIVLPDYVEVYSRQIIDQGMEVELVLSQPVLEALVANYQQALETSLQTGRLRLQVVERTPPFSTILAQDDEPSLAIVVYGESGGSGVIQNSRPEAVDWGREWISTWESRAEPISYPADIEG